MEYSSCPVLTLGVSQSDYPLIPRKIDLKFDMNRSFGTILPGASIEAGSSNLFGTNRVLFCKLYIEKEKNFGTYIVAVITL